MAEPDRFEDDQIRAAGVLPTENRDWQGSTQHVPWVELATGKRYYLKPDPFGREQLGWRLGRRWTNTVPVRPVPDAAIPALDQRLRAHPRYDRVREALRGRPLVAVRCARQWAGQAPVSDWWEAMLRHFVFSIWLGDYDRRLPNELNPAVQPVVDAITSAPLHPRRSAADLWSLLPSRRPAPVIYDHAGSPQEAVWVSPERFITLSRRIRQNVNLATANLLRPGDAARLRELARELTAARSGRLDRVLAAVETAASWRRTHADRLAETAPHLPDRVEQVAAALQLAAIRADSRDRRYRWVW